MHVPIPFRKILKDKYLRAVFALSFLILLFGFIFAYLQVWDITSPLIIHFDVYKGIDFLGNRFDVFGILLTALVMIAVNLWLANFLYYRERFLSFVFGFVSLGLSILILIAISVIISVN